jgi:hypothetical protein
LSFRNTVDNRDSISVQYLAEEVIEVIKNKKDKKSLEGIDDGLNISDLMKSVVGDKDCVTVNNKCLMKRDSEGLYIFEKCPSGGVCGPMVFNPDSTTAVYSSNSGTILSKFTREFYFTQSNTNPNEMVLTVNITWRNKGLSKKYTLQESFYNLDYGDFYRN